MEVSLNLFEIPVNVDFKLIRIEIRSYFIVSFALLLQLTITLKKVSEEPNKTHYAEYCYAGGLVEYVKWLNSDKVSILVVLHF